MEEAKSHSSHHFVLDNNNNSDDNGLKIKLEDVESNSCQQDTSTSFFNTCFHGLNALSGVGILTVPYALASGGWLSLILLFVIALTAHYTGLLMQRCMDVDPNNIRTYPDIGKQAFGEKGRIIVSFFMYVELYIVGTSFLILEGDNLHHLFPNVIGIEVAGIHIRGREVFIIIVALIILPTVWLDNLTLLSYVSATGVFASAIILASVIFTGAFEGVRFQHKGTLVNWSGISTAVSLYAFCYCAHPVFPTLYTSMKSKKQYPRVMLICFTLSTVFYASMGIFGYMMFGPEVQSQITLDLPTKKLSSKIVIYVTLVNPITKYALMVTPIVDAMKKWFPSSSPKRVSSLLMSTSLVISSVIVALSVPFFGHLMSLVGAFLSINASIVVPCVCYMKISGGYRKFGYEVVLMGVIVFLGIIVVVFGTYISIGQLVDALRHGHD